MTHDSGQGKILWKTHHVGRIPLQAYPGLAEDSVVQSIKFDIISWSNYPCFLYPSPSPLAKQKMRQNAGTPHDYHMLISMVSF